MSLDVRHVDDGVRSEAVARLLDYAQQITVRRGLTLTSELRLDQPAAPMDAGLTETLAQAVRAGEYSDHRMPSGAGHDAMIMAKQMPAAMLFLRSPGGVSHHPDESVLAQDVAAALATGERFLELLERLHG
jgi:allantoate deiminase